jgi:hypothetical protein
VVRHGEELGWGRRPVALSLESVIASAATIAEHLALLDGSDLPLCYVEIAHLRRTAGAVQVQGSPPSAARNDQGNTGLAAALVGAERRIHKTDHMCYNGGINPPEERS